MTIEQAKARLKQEAEPISTYIKAFNRANWEKEFGESEEVSTPLQNADGKRRVFRLRTDQFKKIQEKKRERLWFLLKPTLESPVFVFQEQEDIVFVKSFRSKETTKIFTLSVAKKSSNFEVSTFYDAPFSKIKQFVQGCALLYPLKGLSGVTLQLPTQQSRHNAHTSSEGLERTHKNTTAMLNKQEIQIRLQHITKRNLSPEKREQVRRAAVLVGLALPAPQASAAVQPSTDFSVLNIPFDHIFIDKARFQPRDDFSEEKVQEIVQNFNPALFKPLIVWKDPNDGKTYVLAGHHRYEALKRMGRKTAPVVYAEGDEQKAVEIAWTENQSGRSQTSAENAKYLRKLAVSGRTKQEVQAECKRLYDRSCQVALDLSFLNPRGKALVDLGLLQRDSETFKDQETMAQWIGKLRYRYPELTDAHENEVYDWLREHYKIKGRKITNSADFLTYMDNVIAKRTAFGNIDERLNINIVPKSAVAAEYDEQIAHAERELKAALEELNNQRTHALERELKGDITPEQRIRGLQRYEDAVTIAQREVLRLNEARHKGVKEARQSEMSLFGIDDYFLSDLAALSPEEQEFEREFGNLLVPVSHELFARLSITEAPVRANYAYILRKRLKRKDANFQHPQEIKSLVEYTLHSPEDYTIDPTTGYTLFTRSNGKQSLVVVELVLHNGEYRVVTAYYTSKKQWGHKKKLSAGTQPSRTSDVKDKPTTRAEGDFDSFNNKNTDTSLENQGLSDVSAQSVKASRQSEMSLFGLGDDTQIHVVELNGGVYFNGNLKEKRKAAKEFTKQYIGTSVVNMHTGWAIELTGRGLSHAINTFREQIDTAHFEALLVLPELIERAYWVLSEPEIDGNVGSEVHKFLAVFKRNARWYAVKITVKQNKRGALFYDSSVVEEIENPAPPKRTSEDLSLPTSGIPLANLQSALIKIKSSNSPTINRVVANSPSSGDISTSTSESPSGRLGVPSDTHSIAVSTNKNSTISLENQGLSDVSAQSVKASRQSEISLFGLGSVETSIMQLVTIALSHKEGVQWQSLGEITDKQKQDIQQATGINIEDYSEHILDESNIRHAWKRHTNAKIEESRNQIPLTEADFALIPFVLQEYDSIKEGLSGKLQTIEYHKRINGYIVVVEEIRTKRKKLAFKTMYKKRVSQVQPAMPENNTSDRAAQTPEAYRAYPTDKSTDTSLENQVLSDVSVAEVKAQLLARWNDATLTAEKREQVRRAAVLLGSALG